jgi:hypothetical protein
MWIFRFTYCLFNGHSFIEITKLQGNYHYCLHCGKTKEPLTVLKNEVAQPLQVN